MESHRGAPILWATSEVKLTAGGATMHEDWSSSVFIQFYSVRLLSLGAVLLDGWTSQEDLTTTIVELSLEL